MKIAVEVMIAKENEKIEIIENEYTIIADTPFTGDDVEKSDIVETLKYDERIKNIPNGEYHVFLIGEMSYIESYSWEYAATEIDGIEIEIKELSVWRYAEPKPGKSLGEYVIS